MFPLITYHLRPIDAEYGSLLWTSIGILSLAAVVIPLCAPRIYEPVDPEVRLPPDVAPSSNR